MAKFNNWRTVFNRNLKDKSVAKQIDEQGYGVIAKFEHEPTGCEVEYRYEPEAHKPYELTCVTEGVEFEQEGRYETRQAGYENGNRKLRRQNPEIPELKSSSPSTGRGQFDEEAMDGAYPPEMDQYICPVCEKSFSDDGGPPGWMSLHSHMHAHTDAEREKAYADWGAERLKEATIAIWREQSKM